LPAAGDATRLLAAPFLVDTFEDLADRGAGKAARRQKSRLFGALGRRFGELAEFLAPHGLRTRELGFAQLRAGFFDQRLVDRMLLQFTDDPACAQPRRAPRRAAFRRSSTLPHPTGHRLSHRLPLGLRDGGATDGTLARGAACGKERPDWKTHEF